MGEFSMQHSKIMGTIRTKNTKPEMIVRQGLWKCGLRYRLNHKHLPEHSDLVLRKQKTCILVIAHQNRMKYKYELA